MPGCNLLLDGLDESGSGSFGVKANDEANFTPPSLGPNVNGAHGAIVSSVCVKCCNKIGNETMRNLKGQHLQVCPAGRGRLGTGWQLVRAVLSVMPKEFPIENFAAA
jgi:NAD-dependent SIR2 family protein deacetylase